MVTPQLIFLVFYAVLLVVLGLWIGRRVEAAGEFFVAGRRLGPVLLFSTFLAANIGAGSTVGAAGLGYRDGLSAWWWVGSAGIGSLFLGLWVGPRIWSLAQRHDLRTVGDYLELRFGRSVRGAIAALLWLATLAILAGQLIALAWVLNVVAGIPKMAGCIVGGLVMTVYFAAGGLLTSAWVNLLQLGVLLTGFVLVLPTVLGQVGGLGGLQASVAQEGYWNFWRGGPGWTYLALLAPAFIISPGLLQKIYGARDRQTVRWAVTLQGFALMLFAAAPVLLGMAARSLYPDLLSREMALPSLFMHELPPVLGALGLAAIVSAELSSADAILFMLSTSLSQDLYKRFLKPEASDRQVLVVARWAAVGGGVAGVALAATIPTVIDALGIFYSILGVSLFVPVIAGLFTSRGGSLEALCAAGAGVAVYVAVHLTSGGAGFWGWLTPNLLGILAASAGFAIIAAARRF